MRRFLVASMLVSALLPNGGCSIGETGGAVRMLGTGPARPDHADGGLGEDGLLQALDGGHGGVLSSSDAACTSSTISAETKPLDIYLLFDQSGSMATRTGADTRLDEVRRAIANFLKAKESDGIEVGIRYFGDLPVGSASCNPADYEKPSVPIAALPAASDALIGSLNSIVPTGETPTGPALRGGCNYLAAWKAERPNNSVVMLLVTDGVPEAPVSRLSGCDPTLADAVEAATSCVASTGTPIYVLGVGPNLANVNEIAKAGTTGAAYLVDTADVAGDVFTALNEIRGLALPCSLIIPSAPAGTRLDFNEVNVVVTENAGGERTLLNVSGADACDPHNGGWYYAPSAAVPTTIQLCAASCGFARGQNARTIGFSLGCTTRRTLR